MAGLRPYNVLVLDSGDERDVALLEALTRAGCLLRRAADAAALVRLARQGEFDALLLRIATCPDPARLFTLCRRIRPWMLCAGIAEPAAEPPAGSPGDLLVLREPLDAAGAARHLVSLLAARHGGASRHDMPDLLRHVRILCEQARPSVSQGLSPNMLHGLAGGIGAIFPSIVRGVLDLSEETPILATYAEAPVQPGALDALDAELLAWHALLTGRPVPPTLLRRHEGAPPSAEGASQLGDILAVPALTEDGIAGVMAFGAVGAHAYPEKETAFVLHLVSNLAEFFPPLHRMRQMASRDSLTGLHNRGHFEDELQKAWLLSERYGHPMSVLLVDVDGLKSLNDSYGHAAGDTVLRELARLMTATTRAVDVVARYGGDEFGVILPRSGPEEAGACAHRLLAVIAKHVFCREEDHPLHISVSIGAASTPSAVARDGTGLLALADRACYLAKERGRGRICTAEDVGAPSVPREEAAAAPLPPEVRHGTVLVVDDEVSVCHTFQSILEDCGFRVTAETDPRRALDRIRDHAGELDVLVTDLRMDTMDGIQLLNAAQRISPDLVTIVVTGFSSTENAIAALKAGAYDFVRKPVDFREFEFAIARGVERRALRRQIEAHHSEVESVLAERTQVLRATMEALQKSYLTTMELLSTMLALREADTALHNRRVADGSVLVGRRMGLPDAQLDTIRRGALLHDIGKVAVPDRVLLKPGPLDPAEWDIMKRHPATGHQILSTIPFLQQEAEMVYAHHECYDGAGYPRGLRGDAISMGARIFAVVDAFDAMTSHRVYRRALPVAEAIRIIREKSGSQFDPDVVRVFLDCYREMIRPASGDAR